MKGRIKQNKEVDFTRIMMDKEVKSSMKKYVMSSVITFVSTVIFAIAVQIDNSGEIAWSGAFWVGILGTALRAGVKAVAEYVIFEKQK